MMMNVEQATLYQRIRGHRLQGFGARLARENGWSSTHTARVVEEYRRFLLLAVATGHPVSPSDAVDQAWHLHLTDTRDYWERFCPQVLGRALHHEPSRGDAGDQAKLVRQYQETLDSYRRFFGEAPPVDIWPPPARLFADGSAFRRVDTARVWLIPRPPRVFALAVALVPLLAACDASSAGLGLLFGGGFVVLLAVIFNPARRARSGGETGHHGGCSGGGCGGGGTGNCDGGGGGGGSCGDGGGGGCGGGGGGCGGGCGS